MKLYSNVFGNGQPLLILHGFLGMGDNWKTLGKRFAEEAGYEVHLIDQRNHGRSPHSHEFSYTLMAEDLKAYCKTHNLKNSVLLGHSMGGKTAMFAATTYPELFEKLIVVDISPKKYSPHHQQILEGLTAINKVTLKSRSDADEQLSEYVKEAGVRQFLLKNLYWKEKGVLALRMNFDVLKAKYEAVCIALPEDKKYQKSTLFVSGEHSDYIKKSDYALINKHFESTEIIDISKSGHWVHAENPDEFYTAIINFLK